MTSAPVPASSPELAGWIDHTMLAPAATSADIERVCAEALLHRFAAVCVNGTHVRRCAGRLAGSGIATCAVVAFPLGASATGAKVREAEIALEDGARELDMVLNLGALVCGEHGLVSEDIAAVVGRAHASGARVKVILETGLLARAQIVIACGLAEAAGADFVKTSTGFGPRGASLEDVALMRATVDGRLGVKASGGVRTASFARELLAAGATRLGSSASVAIVSG